MMKLTGNPCEDGTLPVVFAVLLFFGCVFLKNLFAAAVFESSEPTLPIARTAFGKKLENMFLAPLVPNSLSAYAAFLGVFSTVLTLPMIWTRLTQGRWMGEFIAQMAIPNAMATCIGCKAFDNGNQTYYHYPLGGDPPPDAVSRDYHKYADWAIFPHVIFGLVWILLGSIQLYFAEAKRNSWVHKGGFHKWFGIVGTVSLVLHMLGSVHILYRDIVHHNIFPKMMLFSDVVMSLYYIFRGIQMRKRAEIVPNFFMHRTMMFFGFVHSIEGSGQIRFTAWYIWVISRYLPDNIAVWFDTTVCQEQSYGNGGYRAAATHCVFPYMVRMNLLRIMTIFFKMVFVRMKMNRGYRKTKDMIAKEMIDQWRLFGLSLVGIFLVELLPDWFQDMFSNNLLSIFFYGNQLASIMNLAWRPYVVVAAFTFLVSCVPESWSSYFDETVIDDAVFGTLTIVIFVYLMHEYTAKLIMSMEHDEKAIMDAKKEGKKAK